ncbi:MAG: PHP domain-containing protein, partial [Alphaproteobacteria bacterium]
MSQKFVHLHLHSAYSLAEGAIKIKDLVKLCVREQMPAVAVTDTNNLFGAMEFALEASNNGIQPIIGCQLTIEGNHQLVLLVQNEKGFRNICKLVSDAHLEGFENCVGIDLDNLSRHSEGLICLSGGSKGPINHNIYHGQNEKAEEVAQRLQKTFEDRFYIELQRHGWAEEDQTESDLIGLAYKYNIPLVASNDCYFAEKEAHEAHDALLCISEGRYVTEEDRRKVTPEHYFKSSQEMISLFKDCPEAIDNTYNIAKRCSFLLEPIAPLLPPFETEGGRSEVEELRAQSKEGLRWRLDNFVLPFKDVQDKEAFEKQYWERLDYELEVIEGMGFPGYFLICSDFISWAKSQNIPVGPGRGSGAGSIIA